MSFTRKLKRNLPNGKVSKTKISEMLKMMKALQPKEYEKMVQTAREAMSKSNDNTPPVESHIFVDSEGSSLPPPPETIIVDSFTENKETV